MRRSLRGSRDGQFGDAYNFWKLGGGQRGGAYAHRNLEGHFLGVMTFPFRVSTGKASSIVPKGGSASLAPNSPHLLNGRSCMVLAIGSGTFRRRERHAHEVA